MADIDRARRVQQVALTTSLNTTPEIEMDDFAVISILVPSGSSITSLTYYAYDAINDTYYALYDKDGNAVVQTVAAQRAYAPKAASYGQLRIKLVANAAGSVIIIWSD